MVLVGRYCIDRFEMSTVDDKTGERLSPFYPPHPKLVESVLLAWQVERYLVGDARAREMPLPALPWVQQTRRDYSPRAVSQGGVVPQGYMSQHLARRACSNAGKRLCTEPEWVRACRGRAARKFPYGNNYEPGRCNVYRHVHPAFLLHGASWYGHRDPRLNLLDEADGSPLLRASGGANTCVSEWERDRVFDMVGNIDEWVDGERPAFLGGFYARSTREGCEARVGSHAAAYYDYSTGGRCCKDATPQG